MEYYVYGENSKFPPLTLSVVAGLSVFLSSPHLVTWSALSPSPSPPPPSPPPPLPLSGGVGASEEG